MSKKKNKPAEKQPSRTPEPASMLAYDAAMYGGDWPKKVKRARTSQSKGDSHGL